MERKRAKQQSFRRNSPAKDGEAVEAGQVAGESRKGKKGKVSKGKRPRVTDMDLTGRDEGNASEGRDAGDPVKELRELGEVRRGKSRGDGTHRRW